MRTCANLRSIPGLQGRVEKAVNEERKGARPLATVRRSIGGNVSCELDHVAVYGVLGGSVALPSARSLTRAALWRYRVLAR